MSYIDASKGGTPPEKGGGPPDKKAPGDMDRRVSPNIQRPNPGDLDRWEYCVKSDIYRTVGAQKTVKKIDIDRQGGVFLDHEELVFLLEGDKEEMIGEIERAVSNSRMKYDTGSVASIDVS